MYPGSAQHILDPLRYFAEPTRLRPLASVYDLRIEITKPQRERFAIGSILQRAEVDPRPLQFVRSCIAHHFEFVHAIERPIARIRIRMVEAAKHDSTQSETFGDERVDVVHLCSMPIVRYEQRQRVSVEQNPPTRTRLLDDQTVTHRGRIRSHC